MLVSIIAILLRTSLLLKIMKFSLKFAIFSRLFRRNKIKVNVQVTKSHFTISIPILLKNSHIPESILGKTRNLSRNLFTRNAEWLFAIDKNSSHGRVWTAWERGSSILDNWTLFNVQDLDNSILFNTSGSARGSSGPICTFINYISSSIWGSSGTLLAGCIQSFKSYY